MILNRIIRSRQPVQPLMVFFLLLTLVRSNTVAQEAPSSIERSIREAAVIMTANVGRLTSSWVSDERGKHIYTRVQLQAINYLKGDVRAATLEITVIGGTVGEMREVVIPSPTFEEGERCLLFFKEGCNELVSSRNAKFTFLGDNVLYENRIVPASVFCQSVEMIARAPETTATLRDVLQRACDQNAAALKRVQSQAGMQAATPEIISVTPPKASSGTSTLVTIKGKNFLTRQDSGSVLFFHALGESGLTAQVTVWSDTQIVCVVPASMAKIASSGPLIVTTSGGLSSNSYPFRITFGYRGSRWDGRRPVATYVVNPNYSDSTGLIDAVRRAGETWNGAGSAFTFDYGGRHTDTSASYNFRNDILWGQGAYGAAATCFYWTYQTTIAEADMVFTAGVPWSTTPVLPNQKSDVETIALHEFGHFLVLGDLYGDLSDGTYDSAKVLYGAGGSRIRRSLHADDMDGIRWVYSIPGTQLPTPVISPSNGSLLPADAVTIVCSAPNVTIRYTTDGSEPSSSSPVYSEPVKLVEPGIVTLKARAYKDGWIESPSTSAQFSAQTSVHKPVFVTKLVDTSIIQYQRLSYTFRASDAGSGPLAFALINPPAGMAIAGNGTLTWIPTSKQFGIFTITVIVGDGIWSDTARATITVMKTALPNAFTFQSNTGKNCLIVIGSTLELKIGTYSVKPGDAMGAFFRRSDTLICAGSLIWEGENAVLTVWGDDDQTTMKDGFAEGEQIAMKIWSSGTNNIYTSPAAFTQGTSTYATNGIFNLSSLRELTPPATPTLLGPADSAGAQSVTPLLTWSKTASTRAYHLQVSLNSAFSTTVVNVTSVSDTSTSVGPLVLGTTYFWRVRAGNDAGWSDFSSTRQFTTIRATSTEQQSGGRPVEFALSQNFPNPFNPETFISYQVSETCPVTLEVFDMLGRRVTMLASSISSPGVYTVRWDASAFPSGIYTYRLKAGAFVQSKRMILMK